MRSNYDSGGQPQHSDPNGYDPRYYDYTAPYDPQTYPWPEDWQAYQQYACVPGPCQPQCAPQFCSVTGPPGNPARTTIFLAFLYAACAAIKCLHITHTKN